MKIRPRIALRAMERAAQPSQEFPAKAAGPLPGTVPARD
jgi:hypothetical protein